MPDRDTPANVFCIGSPFKTNSVDALPDNLAVLIGDWIALSRKVSQYGPLIGKDRWRFDSVTTQLIALIKARFPSFDPAPLMALAGTDPVAMPGRDAAWDLHKKGRIILEALARNLANDRPPDAPTQGPVGTEERIPTRGDIEQLHSQITELLALIRLAPSLRDACYQLMLMTALFLIVQLRSWSKISIPYLCSVPMIMP